MGNKVLQFLVIVSVETVVSIDMTHLVHFLAKFSRWRDRHNKVISGRTPMRKRTANKEILATCSNGI